MNDTPVQQKSIPGPSQLAAAKSAPSAYRVSWSRLSKGLHGLSGSKYR